MLDTVADMALMVKTIIDAVLCQLRVGMEARRRCL